MADLTTLSAVKAYGGITNAVSDLLLADLITRTSATVENYLGRSVLSAARSETRDGTGSNRIVFAENPVTAVSSVVVDGRSIGPALDVSSPGYRFTKTMLVLNGFAFTKGHGNVSLSYTAGYASIPEDIEQAVIESVLLAFKRRDHLDVSSKGLAGETVSFINSELTPAARDALRPYKKVVPA